MTVRRSPIALSGSLLTLLLFVACERGAETAEDPERMEPSQQPARVAPIAGRYEVAGTTIETGTGRKREISGSVILSEDGSRYTASFELDTVFEGEQGVLPAEVIGNGSGIIEGRTLRGTAETQIVISSVPGVDPGFAFIPRATTTRLVSTSVTSIATDGTVEITIENAGAAGAAYQPTRTTLRGSRTGPLNARSDADLPSVATAPPDAHE